MESVQNSMINPKANKCKNQRGRQKGGGKRGMARENGEEWHNESIQMAESIDTVALKVAFSIKNPLSITDD